MPAESSRRFRPAQLVSWLVAAAVICLVVSLFLLGVAALLADELNRPPAPLELAPFRWEEMSA